MITIPSPSMALNDRRVKTTYTMDANAMVLRNDSMRDIVDYILDAVQGAPGRFLQNVVLLAHGSPGTLQLGTGLDSHSMGPFSAIRGKVRKIWFTGCLTGRVIGPETAKDGDAAYLKYHKVRPGDGDAFLKSFARLTGCYLIAPTEIQVSHQYEYPRGLIDSYEGLVLCYDPSGNISWQERYASVQFTNIRKKTYINPTME